MNTFFRTGRNCTFQIQAHLVFFTRYRGDFFTKELAIALENIFQNVCIDFDSKLLDLTIKHDHILLIIDYPPRVALSRIVNSMKGVSARLLKKQFPSILDKTKKGQLWSPSYLAFSNGDNTVTEKIHQHIEKLK